jgi:hypothetical protein
MNNDLISRQAVIDELSVDAELLRRVLDDTDVVGAEREKYEWGLGLIESYISDMEELPSVQPEIVRCEYCNKSKEWPNGRWCSLFRASVNTDSYCSFGAKRKEGQEK